MGQPPYGQPYPQGGGEPPWGPGPHPGVSPPGGGPPPSGYPPYSHAPPPGYGPPQGGGPPGYPPGYDPSHGGDDGGRRPGWVVPLVVLAVVVLVIVGVAGLWVIRSNRQVALGPGEIFLEPAASLGPEPFTNTVASAPPPTQIAQPASSEQTTITPPTAITISSTPGDRPGLYGGTRDDARCDREQIITFLGQNPSHAGAWVAPLNADPTLRWSGGSSLTTADIPTYIRELTPITLLDDTRVTNHGYVDGAPTARQSVLQAGTSVLVDHYGTPRVRCVCGNPLIPPIAAPATPTYVGQAWPGFSPSTVVVVQETTIEIDVIQIVDIDTGDLFGRPVGSNADADVDLDGGPEDDETEDPVLDPDVVLGTGDVQVTLLWSSGDDFDLHVIDPSGEEISFSNDQSDSGGQLDRDEIPTCGDESTHAENVFWPEGGAPSGVYQAFVRNYSACDAGASYVLEVRVGGQVIIEDRGALAEGQDSQVVEFEVG